MKYWLYTWEYPEGQEIEDGEWGLYEVTREFVDEDEELDMVEVGQCLAGDNQFAPGEVSDIYDDSIEDGEDSRSQRRIFSFLLGQDF